MNVEFVLKNDKNNVIACLEMPFPPQTFDKVQLYPNREKKDVLYLVTKTTFFQSEPGSMNLIGVICEVEPD